MRCLVRAGLAAALVALVFSPALAADKAFKQSGLDEAAIKLEAQIKSDAGTVDQACRRRCGAMPMPPFRRTIFAPACWCSASSSPSRRTDASNWLRLARTVLQIKPRDDREKALLLDRASTAAYIAYQRASDRNVEADSLSVLGRTLADRKQWRGALDSLRLSLESARDRRAARPVRKAARPSTVSGLLDYTVDSDSISPRACFQFSEELPGPAYRLLALCRRCGHRQAGDSASEKQLCVEGLKHGERYAVTLRAGLPSVVKETLAKSAEFTIFVRDRKPFVRFSGKAYVLPRTGPARHSGAQRQHQGGDTIDLPDRRSQSRRYASRLRLPAQPEPLSGGAAWATSAAPKSGAASLPSSRSLMSK